MKTRQTILYGIFAVVLALAFTACDDGSGNGGNNSTGINVGQLPEFPSDSTPAGTKTDAETVLAELRQSQVLDSIQEEIWEVVGENLSIGEDLPDNGNYSLSYSFSNRSWPNGFVRVSASAADNGINTGGFQTLSANWKASYDLQDAINSRSLRTTLRGGNTPKIK